MLWALGLGGRVAAVSEACDFPAEAAARAKARRSFAAAPPSASASYASLPDRHPASSTSSSTAAGSRRESPLAAHAHARGAAGAAWQAAGSSASGAAAPCGCCGEGGEGVAVDEEVLARERPGLVVYEESGGGGGAPPGAMLPAGGGMGQAVLEALVAVGLQQSCRVVCVRRRTLADVLESMLVVSPSAAEPACCVVEVAPPCSAAVLPRPLALPLPLKAQQAPC